MSKEREVTQIPLSRQFCSGVAKRSPEKCRGSGIWGTQGFNRYGYAMNSPLMYVDPNGEFWWLIPLAAALVFGTGNTIAHAINGDINSFGDGLKYFGQGALVGAALGAAWQFAPLVPYIGQFTQTAMTWYGYSQLGIGAVGMVGGAVNGGWNGLANGTKAFLGNFYFDGNDFLGGAAKGILRHTWEMPQSLLGHGYTHARNVSGSVDRVDYFGGATFATNERSNNRDGISMGNFININITDEIIGSFEDRVIGDPLFMHEYGHTFDSRIFGPLYLVGIGTPSFISALISKSIPGEPRGVTAHDFRWYEMRANRHASRYFRRYGVDWATALWRERQLFETFYPRRRR